MGFYYYYYYFLHSAALAIVKEVANHANDIMKQGVRAYKEIHLALLILHVANVQLFFLSQDNFQKLIQVQCRLIGNHEIVQPGRVRWLQVFF